MISSKRRKISSSLPELREGFLPTSPNSLLVSTSLKFGTNFYFVFELCGEFCKLLIELRLLSLHVLTTSNLSLIEYL